MKKALSIQPLLEPTASEQILTLPAHLFFVERVEIPDVVEAAELNDFAEITMESLAPFPLEHIYWGYQVDQNDNTMLLYAAQRDRVRRYSDEPIESYAWVLPEFAPLGGIDFPQQCEIILVSETSLSLLQFSPGGGIPDTILVNTRSDDLQPAIDALRKQAPRLPPGSPQLQLCTTPATLDEHGHAQFPYQPTNTSDSIEPAEPLNQLTARPTTAQLWQLDVRGSDFKKAEQSARKLGQLLLKITAWAAIVAVLLLLGEAILFGSGFLLNAKQTQITAQTPLVDKIAEQQELIEKLVQIEQNDLQPIAMLRELNLKRPAGIHFTKAIVEGENTIQLDGVANNVNAMNRYTDLLNQSGYFKLLQQPKTLTRQGKTTFTIQLAFIPANLPQPTTPTETQRDA